MDLRSIAERLAGAPVVSMTSAGQGANSRIFRLETAKGVCALKVYPRRAGDERPRLDVEWRTLRYLHERGLTEAPRAIARDDENQILLMEWIEGELATRHEPADLDAILRFVRGVFQASRDTAAEEFPVASEACLSAADISRQIERRFTTLSDFPPLARVVDGAIRPLYEGATARLKEEIAAGAILPQDKRTLIPADLGFHNAMRQPDGRLRFIDFEYFGWDDPMKFVADFVLHPAMDLSETECRRAIDELAGAFDDAAEARGRLSRYMDLYAARWALIILNPFRTDRIAEARRANPDMQALFDAKWAIAERLIQRAAMLARLA
jgi:hypothetical protein